MKVKLILLAIAFLAFLLRFYQISSNPPGLNSDEAAIGYNAYSILKTGKDEFGQSFPLAFRSFDDYKPPLYIYLTVPSVAIFGLNEFAVRFPSAIMGVLAVVLTYFLTKKLLGNSVIGLLASLLLAISPWHIQFTRTAYETGSMAFFTCLGVLVLLKSKNKSVYILLAALIFGLETYLYQAARIFVPLFSIFSAVIILRKKSLIFIAAFLFFFLPNLYVMLGPTGMVRFRGTSIFQNYKPHEEIIAARTIDWLHNDNKSAFLFHPEIMTYYQSILVGYLSHFRLDFLFGSTNDAKVNYVPESGLLYLWELPFLFIGLSFLLHQKNKTPGYILLAWVVTAPIAASVTNNLPSSIRTADYLPALQILTGIGTFQIIRKFKFLMTPLLLVFIYMLAFYLHMLFIHAPVVNSKYWYFGYKNVVQSSQSISNNYDRIIVSTNLDVPHIFFLFYEKYDPKKYQLVGGTISGGFSEQNNRLDKYAFRNIDWAQDKNLSKTLLIGVPADFAPGAKIIKKFSYLDGAPSIYFVDEK